MPKKPKKKRYLRVIDVGHGIDYTTRTDPQMAHTFDTKVKIPAAANSTTAANPATGTVSIASDVTLVTLGIIYNGGASDRLGGAPTIGGVPFQQADQNRKHTSPEAVAELWYLTSNIPTGTNLVSIPNAPTARAIDAFVSTYKAPAGFRSVLDVAAGTGTISANPSVRLVTTSDGDVIVGVVADGVNAWGPTEQSGTVIYNEDPSTWGGGAQYILQAAAGEVISAWIVASDDWGSVAAAFKQQSTNFSGTVTDTGLGTDEVTVRGKGNIEQASAYIEYSDPSRQISQEFAYIEYVESTGTAPTSVNVSDTGIGNDTFEYSRTLPSGTFPNLARLLDDFNRESLGSNWTPTIGQPAIVGNKFVGLTSGTVGNTGNEAVWNAGVFGPGVQWYITIGSLQPSGTTPNNEAYISYDRVSSTGTISLNVIRIYDTFIDHIQLFSFSPNTPLYDNWTVGSTFAYPSRPSIRIGLSHQSNGYVTIYLDRGNGWEAIGDAFYTGDKFVPGTVRLFLKASTGAGIFVPTIDLDDFYVSTVDNSAIFVTGSMSEGGFGTDSPEIGASLNVTDDSLGGDFLNLSASVPISDFAFSSEEISILQAVLILIADIGEALDAVSIQATLSMSEDANGQDTLVLQASLALSDTASGVDSPEVGASLGVNDTGLGGDFLDLSASIPVSDLGTGIEAFTLSATITLSDTGNGLDEVTVSQISEIIKTILDTASGLDAVSIQVSLSTTETATGQDAILLQATLGLSDSSVGVDSPEVGASLGITDDALGGDFSDILASLSVSEAGTASELLQLLASLSVSDTGSGTDAVNVITSAIKSIADSGLGSDDVSISVNLSVSDDGTGTDALTISVSITVLDSGLGTDAITVLQTALKQIVDSASGSDNITISASLNVGETSFGIDDPAIQVALGLADSGEGLESPQISAELTITDSSSATDIISVLQTALKIVQDAGAGTDEISQITASIPVSELGLGSDQIGQILASLLVTDFGTGVDVVVKFDSTSNILKITFELRKPKIVATLSQPAISIELTKPMVKFSLNTQ